MTHSQPFASSAPENCEATLPESASSEEKIELLTFVLADQDFAIDIMLVREIRNWSVPTPLPKTPDYVHGVINLRGMVLPILDLAKRLELSGTRDTSRPVFVVVNEGNRVFGISVDAVSDILTIPRTSLQETPTTADAASDSCVSGLILEDERVIRMLSIENLAPRNSDASSNGAFTAGAAVQ